jgi:hypothetical protein
MSPCFVLIYRDSFLGFFKVNCIILTRPLRFEKSHFVITNALFNIPELESLFHS